MATQFEAGMLPAVSDVGEALADSLQQGGVNFQDLGRYAGDVVRGIALVFLGARANARNRRAPAEIVFEDAFDAIKNHTETRHSSRSARRRHGRSGRRVQDARSRARKGQTGIVDAGSREAKGDLRNADGFDQGGRTRIFSPPRRKRRGERKRGSRISGRTRTTRRRKSRS